MFEQWKARWKAHRKAHRKAVRRVRMIEEIGEMYSEIQRYTDEQQKVLRVPLKAREVDLALETLFGRLGDLQQADGDTPGEHLQQFALQASRILSDCVEELWTLLLDEAGYDNIAELAADGEVKNNA